MTNKLATRDRAQIFLIGAVIGFIVFVAVYGLGVVNFTNDTFLINGYIEKDIEQHYAGWMLYRSSPWQFPLGVGQNIAYPYGSSVSYTDSIPLFAIFFKIFRNLLPHTFQYFGLFVMLCFMLQGGFGGLLTSLFTESKVMCGLSSLIFVLSPVMIERAFRHCALTAHFIILAELYYYFKNNGDTSKKALLPLFVLNALGITIHPYYLPFTFAIMFAFCVELFFRDKKYTLAIGGLLSSIVTTLIVGWVIGAFYVGGSMASIGYGSFNMNLNSFYNPVSVGMENWSKIIGIRPFYVQWQIEGFNFLGLGVLIFMPISAVLYIIKYKTNIFSVAFKFIKKHFGIIFSAVCVFLFAVGDWFTFGGLRLFRLPIPEKLIYGLFGIFRANGRFGWLIDYLIVIFIIYMLCTATSKKKHIILLSLAVVMCSVQLWDMSDLLSSKHSYFTNTEGDLQGQVKAPILSNSFWDVASDRYDYGYLLDNGYSYLGIEIARTWGKKDKAVFTNFQARTDEKFTNKFVDDAYLWLNAGTLGNDSLICIGQINKPLSDNIYENGYSVYYCDHTYIVCYSKFTDVELKEFSIEGDFNILMYPYEFLENE